MKYSEAMLKGFELVNGRNCTGHHFKDKAGDPILEWDPKMISRDRLHSVCVNGAAILGAGEKVWSDKHCKWIDSFRDAWGVEPQHLNNDGTDWRDIYGMAVAAGL